MSVVAIGTLASLACSGGEGSTSSVFASGDDEVSTSGEQGDSGESIGTSTDGDSSESNTDEGPKFDIASDESETGVASVDCGVDILFIVDNSGSMDMHKDAVIAAFSGFVDEMVGSLMPDTSVHVGITRATGFFDPGNGSGWGGPSCEFSFLDGVWHPPDQGNNGINGQQGRLYEHQGQRYFEFDTSADTAPLEAWFQGSLAGSIAGDQASNSESVVAGAAYPFHPINADFNAGFLRDKAVLVLFLLSDAPDATPDSVATADLIALVSDAKAGCGDGCILPTGVIQGLCYANPENTNTRLTEFMNGFAGPPVAVDFFTFADPPASFTSVLGTALAESIAYTCEEIVPVG